MKGSFFSIKRWKIAIKAELQAYIILGIVTLVIYIISLFF